MFGPGRWGLKWPRDQPPNWPAGVGGCRNAQAGTPPRPGPRLRYLGLLLPCRPQPGTQPRPCLGDRHSDAHVVGQRCRPCHLPPRSPMPLPGGGFVGPKGGC